MEIEKDAYYFPHFSNARNDPKIVRIRRVLGIEGYGIYFMLLEVLRDQSEFKYPIKNVEDLAYEWHTSKEKVLSVITEYELFEIDRQEMVFSPKLIAYLQPYLVMKEQRRNAVKSRWAKQKQLTESVDTEIQQTNTTVIRPYNESNTTVIESKVKESKVKESKDITTTTTPPTEISNFNSKLFLNDHILKNHTRLYMEFPFLLNDSWHEKLIKTYSQEDLIEALKQLNNKMKTGQYHCLGTTIETWTTTVQKNKQRNQFKGNPNEYNQKTIGNTAGSEYRTLPGGRVAANFTAEDYQSTWDG